MPKAKIQILAPERKIVLPDLPQFHTVFPHGQRRRVNGSSYWLVQHGLPETRLLRRLGAKVPDPMGLYYKWPRKPWDAQRVTSSAATMYKRFFILNEMGTGKTFAALAAADYLMQAGEITRCMVCAPVSTLGETWKAEIARWFPHRTCAILHADAKTRRKRLAVPCDFYIINHDGVEVLANDLNSRADIDLFIIDELAIYRNGRPKAREKDGTYSYRHRLFSFTQQALQGRNYVWGMTGAPCPNEPLDAWAQTRLITPERVGWSWLEFRNKTMIQLGQGIFVNKDDWEQTVYKTMQPAVRFAMSDCQDLPPVVEEARKVPFSKLQQKAYDTVMVELKRAIQIVDHNGQPVMQLDSVNEAVQLNKLLQIAAGWPYDSQGNAVNLNPTGRLKDLLSTIHGAASKVIVFVPYLGAIDGVADFLRKHKVDCETISSRVSRPARDKIFKAFQHTPKYKALVAQPGTMSHGLTLTAANVIVWYAPIHSLDKYIQANRRITRPGQINRQVVVHLSGSPVEDRVFYRLRRKERMLNVLLNLFERGSTTGDDYGKR